MDKNNVVLYFYAADLRTLVSDPSVTHVRLEFPPGTDINTQTFTDTISGEGYGLDDKEAPTTTCSLITCPRPCGTPR